MTAPDNSDPVAVLQGLANDLAVTNRRMARMRRRTQVLLVLAVVALISSLVCSISGNPGWAKVAPVFSLLGSGLGFAGWWFGRIR